MKSYEIIIECTADHSCPLRLYRGKYRTVANAAFGALRKRENEIFGNKNLDYQSKKELLNKPINVHIRVMLYKAPSKITRIT